MGGSSGSGRCRRVRIGGRNVAGRTKELRKLLRTNGHWTRGASQKVMGFSVLDTKFLCSVLWRRTNRDAQTLRPGTTNQSRPKGRGFNPQILMKSKLKSGAAVRSSDTARCFRFLEMHGGKLSKSWCRTEWPDGTVTPFAWQYAAGDIGVLGAKTAIGAILEHMAASKRVRLLWRDRNQ